MSELADKLRRQIAEGPEAEPLPPEGVIAEATSDAWIRLLVALGDDEALHVAFARQVDSPADVDAAGRIAFVRAVLEEVDRAVDTALEGSEFSSMLQALARADVPWSHERLTQIVAAADEEDAHSDEDVAAAALTLARGEVDELSEAIDQSSVIDDVLLSLRAAGLEGRSELGEMILFLRIELEDLAAEAEDEADVEGWIDRLDGVAALLDPELYGRGLLAGDYHDGWLDRPASVADFLQAYGPSDWLEVQGLLELGYDPGSDEDDVAFALGARLAVAAAAGIGTTRPEEHEVDGLLELLTVDPEAENDEGNPEWQSLATELGFGLQLALGGDAFALPLVQAAAHERLVTWGIHSPGVPGLPLSTTTEEELDTDPVFWLMGEAAGQPAESWSVETRVTVLRTLTDARTWARKGWSERDGDVEDLAGQLVEMFADVDDPGVNVATRRLKAEIDPDFAAQFPEDKAELLSAADILAIGGRADAPEGILDRLESLAAGEGPLAMEAARLLAENGSLPARRRLGRLWTDSAPVLRSAFVRQALVESLSLDASAAD